jgi:hypothetical protein
MEVGMRIGPVVCALATLAAFSAATADSVEPPAVQGSDGAAVVASPAPTKGPDSSQGTGSAESQAPAGSAESGSDAAERDSSPAPAADASAKAEDAGSSQPIALKMATVPPPADFKVPAGYRQVKRGLDTVYCKTVTPIGSRMPQTYCMSREQVEQIQRQAEIDRQMLKEKARTGGTSGG